MLGVIVRFDSSRRSRRLSDLRQHAHEDFVDVMVERDRHFEVREAVYRGGTLCIWKIDGGEWGRSGKEEMEEVNETDQRDSRSVAVPGRFYFPPQ